MNHDEHRTLTDCRAIIKDNQQGGCMGRSHLERLPANERFWLYANKNPEQTACWLWIGPKTKSGYGRLKDNDKTIRAHRFSYMIHNGPIPEGLLVCHNCPGGDNPLCVNPEHLWLGTSAENSADMVSKGRSRTGEKWAQDHPKSRKGENNSRAKLTASDIYTIRRLIAENSISQYKIAKIYGIAQGTVHNIKSRRIWSHLP